jgi:DNA-binding NtrC family response regulator
VTLDAVIFRLRREWLSQELIAARGNQCKAAERLGVHRNTLAREMDEVGIKRSFGRAPGYKGRGKKCVG